MISRLSVQLNNDVQNVLHHSKVSKYISIYKKLMQRKQDVTHIPNTMRPSPDMVKDVISLLEEEVSLERIYPLSLLRLS